MNWSKFPEIRKGISPYVDRRRPVFPITQEKLLLPQDPSIEEEVNSFKLFYGLSVKHADIHLVSHSHLSSH